MTKRGILFVVSGPSGAGKGTICKELVKRRDDVFLSVSATTRKPRVGEEDGVHYFFISKEEFEENINGGRMLEYAQFCGNYYGTPAQAVEQMLSAGKNVILEIEVQGAMKVKEKTEGAVFIFVLPPSMKELRSRLVGRGTESPDIVEKRLKTAAWEFEHIAGYDYMLLNDSVSFAAQRLEKIIDAEHLKINRNLSFIKEVCKL